MKKKLLYLLVIIMLMMPCIVFADTPSRQNLEYVACGESGGIPAPVPQLTSALYTILIIATPIALVIFSIVALVKAITSGSQDDIKKAQSKVIKKFIAAALVFFIAGMVQFVITKAADASEKTSIVSCIDCFLYHENCSASTSGNDVIVQEPENNDFVLPQGSSGSSGNSGNSGNTSSGSDTVVGNYTVHTSSVSGIKYTVYNQADSTWGSVTYSDGSTIKDIGCMITSAAVVSSASNSKVTPKTVFDSYKHSHPYTSVPPLSNNKFSCSMVNSPSSDSIKQSLKSGNAVIIKVYGQNKGGSSKFTSSQHYMALVDINSAGDQIYVGNAYSSSGYGKSGWYSASEVLTSVQTAEICVPDSSLKNSGSNSSSNNKKATKTIFVGDSRTVGICQYGNTTLNVGKCRDYLTVSQGGMGYNWFESTGIPNVTSLLKKNSSDKFNILILLGVNDIQSTEYWADAAVKRYMDLIKVQAKGDWKNHNIIFVSVTPIGGASTGGSWPVTQTNINYFNSKMKSEISKLGYSNFSYCDINSGLDLSGKIAGDKLHYTSAGYTAVYEQVVKKCL